MSNIGRSRSKISRKVFTNSYRRKNTSVWQQVIEASGLFLAGSTTIYFLNWLPQRLYAKTILVNTFNNLFTSFVQVVISLLSIGAAFLIVIAALLGLIMILGSLFRFTKLIIAIANGNNRN